MGKRKMSSRSNNSSNSNSSGGSKSSLNGAKRPKNYGEFVEAKQKRKLSSSSGGQQTGNKKQTKVNRPEIFTNLKLDEFVYNSIVEENYEAVANLINTMNYIEEFPFSALTGHEKDQTRHILQLLRMLESRGYTFYTDDLSDTDLPIVKFVIERTGANSNVIEGFVKNNQPKHLKYMIKSGFQLPKNSVATALKYGSLSVLKYLLSNGAPLPDKKTKIMPKQQVLTYLRPVFNEGYLGHNIIVDEENNFFWVPPKK